MFQSRSSGRKGGSVEGEVQALLRKNGKITNDDFMRLRSSHKDEDLVSKIQDLYIEKQSNLLKKAKKFADLIREKYSQSQTPFHILLEKAHKYKVKYGLTDAEFAEFQRIYEQELVGNKSVEVIQPSTNIQKVLGGVTLDYHGSAMKLNGEDSKYAQELMAYNAATKSVHAQVLLQALKYRDCDLEAMTGVYDRNIMRINDHVHPVVAALFLPKIKIIENHFLYSNISAIVKARLSGEKIVSLPDYELFYALTTDPNDVVCDSKSTILDLLNRAKLQAQLWNCVLHLRSGQYYQASFKDFIASIDLCRLNKQDTPDFVYGRFDGVVLKRLVSAFSFRPTVVSTLPYMVNPIATNPYAMNMRPQVTAVPMINMRIPPKPISVVNNDTQSVVINLDSATKQVQFFIENGQIVPKQTDLIYSRGVLIFYVDRRATTIKINDQLSQFSLTKLPQPIAGFEKLNKTRVGFNRSMKLRDEVFMLKSVVFSEVNIDAEGKETDVVVGSSAVVLKARNENQEKALLDIKDGVQLDAAVTALDIVPIIYDPYSPVLVNPNSATRGPMHSLSYSYAPEDSNSFEYLAGNKGTIFIYKSISQADGEKEIGL
jgi:hypothetical protein